MYEVTNENIYCIKRSLNPQKGDKIYSILGSGDIPFMFIENGADVLAIDKNLEQIKYANRRIDYFLKAKFKKFKGKSKNALSWKNKVLREKYFSEMNLQNFNDGLGNLEFICSDFFKLGNLSQNGLGEFVLGVEEDYSYYNKVYLSNSLDYYLDELIHLPSSKVNRLVEEFFEKFKSGTQFHLASFYCKNFEKYSNLCELKVDLEGFEVDGKWKTFLVEKK